MVPERHETTGTSHRAEKDRTLHAGRSCAGVSTATVSRVVAWRRRQVSPRPVRRCSRRSRSTTSGPATSGRALVERRHAALGIVFPGLSGPYYSEVINGFEQEALEARVSVLILGTHLLKQSGDLVLDMADRVDGIAVMGGALPDDVWTPSAGHGCPVVLLASRPLVGVPTVRIENAAAMRAADQPPARRPRLRAPGVRRQSRRIAGRDLPLAGLPAGAPRAGCRTPRRTDPGRAPAVRRVDRGQPSSWTMARARVPSSVPTTRPRSASWSR